MGLREDKKQQTRQHIAEIARRRFAEAGFERVTVAEIAREAQVSTKTVFNYFATKEDLVYWRLESFEQELLGAIRDRPPGETVLEAFGRFVLAPRGMLGDVDAAQREQLAALTHTIAASPALLAREEQIFAGYTRSLAALLAQEQDGGVEPAVVASTLIGVHRALVDFARGRILAGARHPALADEVRAEAERALGLIAGGLGGYAVKAG
ncbi:MAG TPA: TetR/AcrR family transcriptional regulator [Solirubrobacteraceae bacterium]|nr:TetR/AcrR family transcriptional regulator [Solirubrobacteraceae bacterium]